jgi:hypothetical protein
LFLLSEAATLSDPFDRQACVRKETPCRFHPQPTDAFNRHAIGSPRRLIDLVTQSPA